MKTMNREEAIIAMVEGKEVTSNEFGEPDYTYCIYNKAIKDEFPFRYIHNDINTTMAGVWNIKTWRLRKYIPKDKELVFCWEDEDTATAIIRYYDAKNNCTFDYEGNRNGLNYNSYAPYTGELSPNMCKPEELEE